MGILVWDHSVVLEKAEQQLTEREEQLLAEITVDVEDDA